MQFILAHQPRISGGGENCEISPQSIQDRPTRHRGSSLGAIPQGRSGEAAEEPQKIFKALMVKRSRQFPSDRELYRRLWDDEALREVCDIEKREKPYYPSQLTRFRTRLDLRGSKGS
ncbi:MAG: transposase [Candidatus Hydrothermarchaeota archaeon]|nr:transposase [Candidatus Hydrothermarchaeota archaeon]